MTITASPTPKPEPKKHNSTTPRGYSLRSYKAAEELRKSLGFNAKSMAQYLGITEKTYGQRRQERELKDGESLKVEMFAAIFEEATRVFRSQEEAKHWITSPIISLEHKKPIEHLTSING